MTDLTDKIAALPPIPLYPWGHLEVIHVMNAYAHRNALLCEALDELIVYACEHSPFPGYEDYVPAEVRKARAILAACEVKHE